jgi:hypothetical protein
MSLLISGKFTKTANSSTPSINGAHAYMSDQEDLQNKTKVGNVNTKIVEEFVPPSKLTAGEPFTKDVKVQNLGPTACFIRVKAVFTDSDIGDLCEVDWNSNDFIYNPDDGFWYYPNVLEANELTPSLFTQVKVLETVVRDDGTGTDTKVTISVTSEMLKDFDIIIYQEAYQAKYNGSDYETDENGYFVSYLDAWSLYQTNKPAVVESGYFIAYYSNNANATGSMEISTHKANDGSTLNQNAFAVEGYEFAGWNTKKDGSGTSYGDGVEVNMDVEENTIINLYAQWTAISQT